MSDLTRYRIDHAKAEPIEMAEIRVHQLKEWGVLLPDSALQDIADAWKRYSSMNQHELFVLLDGLQDGE